MWDRIEIRLNGSKVFSINANHWDISDEGYMVNFYNDDEDNGPKADYDYTVTELECEDEYKDLKLYIFDCKTPADVAKVAYAVGGLQYY